nr:flavodoxin [Peristeroidobacter soli]
MTALAGISLGGASLTAVGGEARVSSRTLVAYFSRSGNTRVVAGLIRRTLNADLFEIQPATPYPEDYLETVEQARQERDSDHEPALAASVARIANYDTVFLGFPIWGETTPPVIRSFLSAHDLSDKPLIPFITHGGYGLGNSRAVLARRAPRAELRQGFSMQADQERQTMNLVNDWMKSVNVTR